MQTPDTPVGYFSSDRAAKYGWGLLRLGILTWLAFLLAPRLSPASGTGEAAGLGLASCIWPGRWVPYALLGIAGAIVNVRVLSFAANLALLLVGAVLCLFEARCDSTILIVLGKTFAGDCLAGKVDTAEWKLVLAFVLGMFGLALIRGNPDLAGFDAPLVRIALLLFLAQVVCELGDRYLERHVFFRHRYSYETACIAILFMVWPPLTAAELRCVQYDMVLCLFYRIGNYALILGNSGMLWNAIRRVSFPVFGLLRGMPLVHVKDPALAMAVLEASDEKGAALERYIACPAWRPLVSLESIDGPLQKAMMTDLHTIIARLPPATMLQVISQRLCDARLAAGTVIDADAVAVLSMSALLEYLFGKPAGPELRVLVDASWEWRKELAVRGRGDPVVKARAVDCVVRLLQADPHLGPLYGDRWKTPRFYSLIMQPFLISPTINATDVAVTFKSHPTLPVQEAIRVAHPFPILERRVHRDLEVPDGSGRVAIKAGTQVIIFTADLQNDTRPWPVFGSGPRACAGMAHALALLGPMHRTLREADLFRPALNHRYSGRNNDNCFSCGEAWYFLRVAMRTVLFARGPQSEDEYIARTSLPE